MVIFYEFLILLIFSLEVAVNLLHDVITLDISVVHDLKNEERRARDRLFAETKAWNDKALQKNLTLILMVYSLIRSTSDHHWHYIRITKAPSSATSALHHQWD